MLVAQQNEQIPLKVSHTLISIQKHALSVCILLKTRLLKRTKRKLNVKKLKYKKAIKQYKLFAIF